MTMSSSLFGSSPLSAAAQGLDKDKSIEQILKHLPYDCRLNTRTGFSFRQTAGGVTRYVHARCRKLTCRTCAYRRYHELTDTLRQAVLDHHLLYFVTLTLPPMPLPDQEPKLKRALLKLLSAAARTFPGPLHYVWVLGAEGRDGSNLHLHMLLNLDLRRASRYGKRTAWLKEEWHRQTGSQQVKVREIQAGTEWKVVRYMLQNMFATVLVRPDLRRRCGCSRSIKLTPPRTSTPEGTKWERLRHPSAHYAIKHGVVRDPILNLTFDIQDASASSDQTPPALPLRRSDAVTTVPAGKRAAVESSVAGVTDE